MKYKKKIFLAILTGMLLVAAGCSNGSKEQNKTQQVKGKKEEKYEILQAKTLKIEQIRGIGYPGNDNALYVATLNGLKLYKDTKWFETTTNRHDYLGFQAIEAGFLASGHPQKGKNLKDPLGLVQSVDKGRTLTKLAFYGQKAFYFMSESFSGSDIYVVTDQPNNDLGLGVNYSKDNGASWNKSAFKDFNADSLGMIAVHPTNGDIMAMSTRTGVFYSKDNGNTMMLITDPFMVTALTFMGDSILFSSVEGEKILLKKIQPISGEQTSLPIPFLDYENPITYLAVNPKNENQMAFTTYKNDLFESIDGGKTWKNRLKDGKKVQD